MTDALNPATFDIADMFAGTAYPETVVPFYTDQKIAYEFHKLAQEAVKALQNEDQDAAKDIAQRQEDLVKAAEEKRFEIHLRGQSRDNRTAVLDSVRAEFPAEVDPLFGREKPNEAADRVYTNRMWALFIEKIVSPDGRIMVAPTEEQVKALRGRSADSELAKVEKAIQELSEGAKSGFESLAQEHDFLSSASPEA